MPPTISRLRGSSVAMRMYMSISKVLWWVMKGRAVAPPLMVFNTGVSTSIYPRSSRKRRRYLTKALRTSKFRRNFSGRGSRDLLSRVMVPARTLISPRCVRNTSPLTPTMSPMSNFRKRLYSSSSISSFRA